jgi:hypothetical protein
MSNVNRRIIDTIEAGNFPKEVKDLLKTLLNIELRNFQNRMFLYGKDYDRVIMELAESWRRRKGQ